jgi:hypothetical protein
MTPKGRHARCWFVANPGVFDRLLLLFAAEPKEKSSGRLRLRAAHASSGAALLRRLLLALPGIGSYFADDVVWEAPDMLPSGAAIHAATRSSSSRVNRWESSPALCSTCSRW